MDTIPLRVLALALLLGGCIGVSPEQREADQYPYDDDEGPEHNPGLPCLACHDRDFSPGEDVFALAGTVYRFADDAEGVEGVEVQVTDADGNELTAVSNRAGNFMFEVDEGERTRQRGEGRTEIGFWPAYPMTVRLSRDGIEQEMLTRVQREGSCNACHMADVDEASVGRIYLEER